MGRKEGPEQNPRKPQRLRGGIDTHKGIRTRELGPKEVRRESFG